MSSLLDQFMLVHTQVTRLNAELKEIVPRDQQFTAKVELKLTPRQVPPDQGANQFQLTARLLCEGRKQNDASIEPLFTLELAMQTVYRQFAGEPVTLEQFSGQHGSLARQIYPLLHQLLQPILKQFGLDQVRLPHDLADRKAQLATAEKHNIH